MNVECEQLRSDLSLEIAKDEVLPQKKMFEVVAEALGEQDCEFLYYNKTHKVLKYRKKDGSYELLLVLAVSFMGGQHPVFRHRSQLKTWYKEFYEEYKNNKQYNVRIIGVYHYQGNIIFVDYEKETYLKKKMHNSAAWVYTNDLYQAMRTGIFTRVDKNGNRIHAIKYTKFRDYINGFVHSSNDHIFSEFKKFNSSSSLFTGWIRIDDALREMHDNNWPNWRQTEWFGWYLEYQLKSYIEKNKIESIMKYTGRSNKSKDPKSGLFDFDLWFEQDRFFGDLKSSDISSKETPANDQTAFISCINMYDRFWFIIYEADCVKNPEAAEIRYKYMESVGESPKKNENPDRKHRLLKEKVNFQKMTIIELNRINYREALIAFNQGRQPNGGQRNKKFSINKNNIDNFIIFSEDISEIMKRKRSKRETSLHEVAIVAEKPVEYKVNE